MNTYELSEEEMKERVTLVASSFESNYTRKRLKRVSIYQLMNRLFLLFQEPIIFMIYKTEVNKDRLIFNTYRDILYDEEFVENIMDVLHNEEREKQKTNYFYTNKKFGENNSNIILPNRPQKIKNTGYSMILVDFIEDESGVYFEPVNEEDQKYYIIKMLWDNIFESSYSKNIGIPMRIKYSLENIMYMDMARIHMIDPFESTMFDFNNEDKKFLEEQLKIIKEIIEDVYTSIKSSPLLDNKGSKPSNIYFALRYFGDEETINRYTVRHESYDYYESYPYSVKMIFPKTQENDIKEVLLRISEDNTPYIKEDSEWTYTHIPSEEYKELGINKEKKKQINEKYPDKEIDKCFWDMLDKGNVDDLMSSLKAPANKASRSIIDSVLLSGFSSIIYSPYIKGGRDRVTAEEYKKGFESDQVKRNVALHYILSSSVDDSTLKKIKLVVVPLRVGGYSYAALVHALVSNDNNRNTGRDNWLRYYHFFTDVVRHCVRRIRYTTTARYISEIETQIIRSFIAHLKMIDGKEIGSFINSSIIRSNRRLLNMCRVWPYQQIRLDAYKNNIIENNNLSPITIIGDKFILSFKKIENPFYGNELHLGLSNDYLDDEVIHKAIDSAARYIDHYIYLHYKNVEKHNIH